MNIDLAQILLERHSVGANVSKSYGFTDKEMGYLQTIFQQNPQVPQGDIIKSFFTFRVKVFFCILIMCDKMHDFTEKEERNKLTPAQIMKVANAYISFFTEKIQSTVFSGLNGINYLSTYCNEIGIYFTSPINSKGEFVILKAKNKYEVAENCIKYLGIIGNPLREVGLIYGGSKATCSGRADYLLNYLKTVYLLDPRTDIMSSYTILLAVDADKSKYTTSSLTNMACDSFAREGKFKVLDSLASDYDSADGSVIRSVLNEFKREYNVSDMVIKQPGQEITYNLVIGDLPIASFTYKKSSTFNDLHRLINDIFGSGDINSLNLPEYKLTKDQFKSAFTLLKTANNGNIPDELANEGWGQNATTFSNQFFLDKSKPNYQLINDIFIGLDPRYLQIMFNETLEVSALQVNNYFGIPNSNPPFNSIKIKSTGQVSVKELTEYGQFNAVINAYSGPKDTTNRDNIVMFSSYKTLGDLGQIVALNQFEDGQTNFLKVFLSFDRICSMISSLFIRSSLFERAGEDVPTNPMICYSVDNEIKENIAVGILAGQFAPSLLTSHIANFGKRRSKNVKRRSNKVKRRSKNVKRRSKKVKKCSNKLKKIAKRYCVSVKGKTVKKITSDIKKTKKKLKKIQKLAKKLKIKLTKRSRSGKRTYKSVKQLTKEIKRGTSKRA